MLNLRHKMMIASVIAVCVNTVSFADQSLKANVKARFAPTQWVSVNKKDVVSIKIPTDGYSSYYGVQIHVNSSSSLEGVAAGIDIKNCNGLGSVDHVSPSSSIVCGLTKDNPLLTFSSDSDTLVATGETQVE